jgi:cytochrome P450
VTAPASVAPALTAQIRRLLDQASPTTVPGGVLLWWGTTALPDGGAGAPALSWPSFQGAYMRLENGATGPGVVRPLAALAAAAAAYRPDGPLPIVIARQRYAVPRAKLAADVQRAAAKGRALANPPRSLAGQLDERMAFLAGGLLHDQWGMAVPAYRGRRVPWLVTEELCLGDSPPDHVEIDPGDGGGFQVASMGVPVEATYPDSAPAATVTVRCQYGAETLTARFEVALSDQPAAPLPDETWPLRGANGNTGTAYVYLASPRAPFRHPLIMVEGFPGGHPADYLYDTLDQQRTATSLRAAGYDIVLVGLDQGMDKIQHNADVLVACLRNAMGRTDAPLIVGGMSMGGLISRYALAAMEKRGEDHHTTVFVTLDTPHGGTYTSLAAQWFVQTYRPYLPALGAYAELLDSAANQQFDLWWVHDGAAAMSRLRKQWVRDLAAVGGYPDRPRRLAMSCGRGDGVRETAPGTQLLTWSGEPWVSAQTSTLSAGGGTIGSGHWFLARPELRPLTVDSKITWDGAPGGQEPYNALVAALAAGVGCGQVTHQSDAACTVPTVSALGLDQDPFEPVPAPGSGHGPFHDYAWCSANQPHLTITPELSNWLLGALGKPRADRRFGPMTNGFDPSTFNPHDPAFLKNPYPTYEEFRTQAPIAYVNTYDSDWMFCYADCVQVLTETDVWIKNRPSGPDPVAGPYGTYVSNFPKGLFSSDPPPHTQLRDILEPLFKAAITDAPQLAQAIGTELLTKARQQGRMELISDYALPLPANVLFTLLGIPDDQVIRGFLMRWEDAIVAAHDITQTQTVLAMGATSSMALNSYFEALLLANRTQPEPGLFAAICTAFDAAGLSPQEVQMCAVDFLVAGYLSTTFIIGTGILNLLRHPGQLRELRKPGANPNLMNRAVEEMLRFDGPVQVIDRYAKMDTKVGGRRYPKNSKVTAVIGSADHDPAVFKNPEAFQIRRANSDKHLAFGDGIHYCIGAPLARLVAPIAIQMLLDAFPNLALDGDPQWQTDPYLRAVTSLPLSF